MKKQLGRELLWLSLPLVLLGAPIFYRLHIGGLKAPEFFSPFASGPERIEFLSFNTVELSPLDVARGYEWGTQTTTKNVGTLNVPKNWQDLGHGGTGQPIRLVYRVGQNWIKGTPAQGKSLLSIELGSNTITIKANLDTVPREAEEIRLQGQFQNVHLYRGTTPPGWVAPKNVTNAGLNHFFNITSKTFDVPIKSVDGQRPSPQVARKPKIEVIEGKWLRDWMGDHLLVRARALPDSGITDEFNCRVEDVSYFDADGKPFIVYDDATSTVKPIIHVVEHRYLSPNFPANEAVARLAAGDAQPRGGWDKVKKPITITGMASDGQCWPTPFKVSVSPEQGEMRNYGGPVK